MRVVNLHEDTWAGTGDYIGRPCILGNPYPMDGRLPRAEVVERYRTEWLWPIVTDGRAGRWAGKPSVLAAYYRPGPGGPKATRQRVPVAKGWPYGLGEEPRQAVWEAVSELMARLRAGERVTLLCYCKPLPCHGDVLGNCLRWLLSEAS